MDLIVLNLETEQQLPFDPPLEPTQQPLPFVGPLLLTEPRTFA